MLSGYDNLQVGDQRRYDLLAEARGDDAARARFGLTAEGLGDGSDEPAADASQRVSRRSGMPSFRRSRIAKAAIGAQPGDDRFVIPAEGGAPDFNWHPDPDPPGKTISETSVDIAGNIEKGRQESLRRYRPDEVVEVAEHDPAAMIEAARRSWVE